MPTTPILDNINGQPVFDVQLQALNEGRDGNGVAGQSDLKVTDGSGANESDIATGTAYYGGSSAALGATATKTHSDGDPDFPRWDIIAFDVSTGSVVLREGTPTDPTQDIVEPPGLQADEVLLAVVYIEAQQTDFGSSDIVNFRVVGGSQISASDGGATVVDRVTGVDGLSTISVTDGGGGTAELAVASNSIDTGQLASGAVTDSEISSSTTISRSKLSQNKQTATVSSATTTSDEEVVFIDTSGSAFTLTLASSDVVDGNEIVVVDVGGAVETNALTIDTESSETIDGQSSLTLDTNYGAQVLQSDGTNWYTAGGGSGGGGVVLEDDQSTVLDPADAISAGEALDATADGDGTGTLDLDWSQLFVGSAGGTIANGNQLLVERVTLADGDTLAVYECGLTKKAAQAAPTDADLELVTFDGAGGFTQQSLLIDSDGTAVNAQVTGSPVGSYTNSSGSAQEVGVIADNQSGSSVNLQGDATGVIK